MKNVDFFSRCLAIFMVMALLWVGSCSKSDDVDNIEDLYDDILDDTDDDNDDEVEDIEFSLSQGVILFNALDSLSQIVTITASEEWVLLDESDSEEYGYAEWVSEVTPTTKVSSHEVTITLDENISANKRSTTLYFALKNNGEVDPISLAITQNGNTAMISADRSDIWFVAKSDDAELFTQEINITTNATWRIMSADDGDEYAYDTSWVTVDPDYSTGAIQITVIPNEEESSDYARTTYMYIDLDVDNFDPFEVKISQFSPSTYHISSQALIETEGVIYIDASGNSESFAVITSHPWSIPNADDTNESGHMSWVFPSPSSGVNGDVLEISCTANNSLYDRTSQLFVQLYDGSYNLYAPFTVVQSGYGGSLSFSEENYEFTSSGGDKVIKVTSSENWKVHYNSPHLTCDDNWLTLSKTIYEESASGDFITFTAAKNSNTLEGRSTEVWFTMDAYSDMEPVVYTVTQQVADVKDATFEANKSSVPFSITSYSQNVTITSDYPWRVMSSADYPEDDAMYDHNAWVTTALSTDGTTAQITVTKNQFNVTRETTVNLLQEQSGKRLEIKVSQDADTDSWLVDYGALGCGYDGSGESGYQEYVKKRVLDCDKLEKYGLISDVNITSGSTSETKVYGSITEVQDSLCIGAGVSASYNGFTASLKSSYGTTAMSYSETEYGSTTVDYERLRVQTNTTSYDEATIAAKLKLCLTDAARDSINNADPAAVIAMYGSHVVLGYTKGAIHEYTISAVRTKEQKNQKFALAVSGGYNSQVGNSFAADAETNYSSDLASESHYSHEKFIIRGGPALTDAANWGDKLNKDNIVLTGFCGNGLFPIWLLADDANRQNDLENAATNPDTSVTSTTAYQSIYQYEFWLGQFYLYKSDGGGNNEISIKMKHKTLDNAGANYSNYSWVDIWDGYIEDVVNGQQANLTVGTSSTGSNRFVTEQMFMGGAAQHEFGIYLFMGESDGGSGATSWDWPVAGYHFFRTQPNYSIATSGADPFTFVYSSNETNQPFNSYSPYATYWAHPNLPAQYTEAGELFNGCVAIDRDYAGDSSNPEYAPWFWKIYYRQLSESEMQ